MKRRNFIIGAGAVGAAATVPGVVAAIKPERKKLWYLASYVAVWEQRFSEDHSYHQVSVINVPIYQDIEGREEKRVKETEEKEEFLYWIGPNSWTNPWVLTKTKKAFDSQMLFNTTKDFGCDRNGFFNDTDMKLCIDECIDKMYER